MADIDLVIKIPEEDYNNIKPFLDGKTIKGGFNLFKVLEIIKNGTILSKGHEIRNSAFDDTKMTVTEILNTIHQQGVENEVFELLTQWMIEDRYNKMKKIGENKAIIRSVNKIATQNKNVKQAIDAIISLTEK